MNITTMTMTMAMSMGNSIPLDTFSRFIVAFEDWAFTWKIAQFKVIDLHIKSDYDDDSCIREPYVYVWWLQINRWLKKVNIF